MKLTFSDKLCFTSKELKRFDHVEFEFVDLTEKDIKSIIDELDYKKIRLILELNNRQDEDDGFSVVVTSSNIKKPKLSANYIDDKKIQLSAEGNFTIPLKLGEISAEDYTLSLVGADIYKGTPDEVTIIIDSIPISEFEIA